MEEEMGKQKRRRRGRKPFIFGERSEVDEKEKGRQLHKSACLSSEQWKKEDNIESLKPSGHYIVLCTKFRTLLMTPMFAVRLSSLLDPP